MNPTSVQQISECFIKPPNLPKEANQPYYLTPWDLAMLSVHYIQKGLLFAKPPQEALDIMYLLDKLKHSLALTLVHFYPLAGRLATSKTEDPPSYVVYVDCTNSPGARLVHAAVNLTVSDVLSPTYVPLVAQSFFDHHRALNHDGHFRSLLTIQVTDLVDGVFIGCSMNHAIGDGSSFWQFLNSFSEIFQAQGSEFQIAHPPDLKRWFPDGYGPIVNLPFTHHEQFLGHFEAPPFRERVFHFSSESIAKLKARANSEYNTNKISSFQSLSAFMWRCIMRTRKLPHDQITSCRLACNNRSRLKPPLSADYFGNCIYPLRASTTAGELLENNLGWAAWRTHQAVVNQSDEKIRESLESWLKSPIIYQIGQLFDPFSVMMGSSPRFNKYGSEFGLGKALALLSGYAHKFSGKVSAYPGREGGGSVDLEVCLPPNLMTALEDDQEFMDAVSVSPWSN
ncbi:Anthranilate N-benzoyltransferase protein, putative [Ricinus communis]|uniref:Anthranilate N-benzoyltransferase protein, putative n=1 Tax=Ricinus communis TaxID=3988 RepID=B9R793_RICCO|nr:Anthranilate N-benzoyltransferase protein, putative [Ricinus communis]|eukprot:XP_002510186.1 uncharacterized acetyltransferase At3g50280 [Ricinus communis]